MLFRKNKKLFPSNLDFYFSPLGCFYVSGPLGVTSNKLFFTFNFNKSGIERSLKSSSFKHFFSYINFASYSVMTGYYVFIDMVGLGYKLKKITSFIYRFYVGQAHYIYLYVPSDTLVWAFQTKITLFSIYPDKLFSLATNIMLLRKLNAYKLRGLMRPGQIVVLKEGKQR